MTSKKPTVRFEWRDGEVWWKLTGAGGPTDYLCSSDIGYPDRASAVKAIDTAVILLTAARRSGPGEKPAEPAP